MDNRGVSPVIGKTFEIGLILLYVGLLSTALYGGIVPGYQTYAGEEVGERVLASTAQRIEAAVPPAATRTTVRRRVEIPSTIGGATYEIRLHRGRLVLDHPNDDIDVSTRLGLPASVDRTVGACQSSAKPIVTVTDGADGRVVSLVEGERT
jgi:hypothetical protein